MPEDRIQITIALNQEEATELFFRCLRSPDEDTEISERVLSKLARCLAEFDTSSLELAA